MDIVQIIFLIIIFIMMIIGISRDLKAKRNIKPNKKQRKKRKYYNPENNYFRNNPEHVDMTESYIDSIWNEMKKK